MSWNEAQRRESTRARGVELEKIKGNFQGVEQPLSDILVAALGVPISAAVAPTQVHSNMEGSRRRAQYPVGDRNIPVDQGAPIVATRRQIGLHIGIAEFCERRLVDLNITAPCIGESNQLSAESLDGVIPELISVTVSRGEDSRITAAEMQRTGPGNRYLGKQLSLAFEKIEIGDIDWMSPSHTAFDEGDRLRSAPIASLCAPGVGACDDIDVQVTKLLVEKTMVRPAPKFAVGRKSQADALLQAKRTGNCGIFRSRQIGL